MKTSGNNMQKIEKCFGIVCLLLVSFFMQTAWNVGILAQEAVRPMILITDFEGDDYEGWIVEGNAFGTAPANSFVSGGMGNVFGHRGRKLVNTFANPERDNAAGMLSSPEFKIERKKIVFHIGGGKFPGEAGISLVVDGKTVATETGLFSRPHIGNEGLEQRIWDLESLQGKKARLLIFDKKEGGDWGHIEVDYIHQADEAIPVTKNNLAFNPDAKAIRYDRMIFGQFIEHFHRQVYGGIFEPGSPLSDENGFRKDVIEAMKELKVPIVRWPGGCFVSAYHWLDGTGPDRQPAYDKAWHVEDPNTFGTAEFVFWCRKIGAEPYICTNAGTGTPEEMSDWVEYCNLNIGRYGRLRKKHGYDQPFNVKYWSIGNENWGGHEMGAKTVEEWGPLVRESGKLMLNTDPSIKLFAAALPDENWTFPLLEKAGYLLDYVSIHGYWDWIQQHDNPAPYLDCMMRTAHPEQDILRTINILERTGNRDRVKIAFDEWNLRGWHHPGHGNPKGVDIKARDRNDVNKTYTMADALFSACFLNSCLRHCEDVTMACFSPIINTRGALYVHPKGIVKRTTFHVFKLYSDELEKNFLPVEFESELLTHRGQSTPKLDLVLTCNDAKDKFVLAVVNKDPEKAVELSLDFENLIGTNPKEIEAVVLSGGSPDDYNDIDRENSVVPEEKILKYENGKVSIPAHTLAFLRLKK